MKVYVITMIAVWAMCAVGDIGMLATQSYPRRREARVDAWDALIAIGFLVWGLVVWLR